MAGQNVWRTCGVEIGAGEGDDSVPALDGVLVVAKKGPAQPWCRGGGVGGMVGGEGKVLDVLWCLCVARMVGGLLVVRRWGWIVRVSGCTLGL